MGMGGTRVTTFQRIKTWLARLFPAHTRCKGCGERMPASRHPLCDDCNAW